MILSLMRLLLLMLSCYGFLQVLSQKLKPEIALGVLFTGIGSVMFLAGILNLLLEMTVLIFISGLGLTVYSILRKQSPKSLLTPGLIFFAVSIVLSVVLLYQSKFTRYDDFSHWATVLKLILEQDRFPNFSDLNIMFQSYPVGSSAFIYYIMRVIGTDAEWVQMCTQMVLMTGMLSGLFCFTKKISGYLLITIFSAVVLASNGILSTLLVDTLLPLIALGGMTVCIYYRKDITKYMLYTVPYTVFLMSVKNSGIFFVLILLLYLLITVKKQKSDWLKWTGVLLSPFVTLLLWQKHVKLVFEDGLQAKHSMSVGHFQTIFAGKTAEDLKTIFTGMANEMFSWDNGFFYLIILAIAVFVLAKYLLHIQIKQMLVLTACSYLGYQIGLFGMYLFSMPLEEALVLASYDRYHNTILIFLIGLIGIMLLQLLEEISLPLSSYGIIAAVLLCYTAVLWIGLKPELSCYQRQVLTDSPRQHFDDLIQEHRIPAEGSYLLVIDPENPNASYLRFMGRYLLQAEQIKVRFPDKVGKIEHAAEEYDYLLLYDLTDATLAWWEEKVGDTDAYILHFEREKVVE